MIVEKGLFIAWRDNREMGRRLWSQNAHWNGVQNGPNPSTLLYKIYPRLFYHFIQFFHHFSWDPTHFFLCIWHLGSPLLPLIFFCFVILFVLAFGLLCGTYTKKFLMSALKYENFLSKCSAVNNFYSHFILSSLEFTMRMVTWTNLNPELWFLEWL